MSRPLALLLVMLAVSAASLFWALLTGTFPVSVRLVLDSLFYPVPGVVHDVIWRMRAPRAAATFCFGGLAALAGALLHELAANALAARRVPPAGAAAVAGGVALLAGASVALMRSHALSAGTAAILAATSAAAGLLARHALRAAGIDRRRWVLPLAALLGGSLLTLADIGARL